jgi:ribosome-associated protein
MLIVGGTLQIPLSEFDVQYTRSSGPGGQNVNKVNSKAVLYWDVLNSPSLPPGVRQRFRERYGHRLTTEGICVITSDKYRDQRRNVSDCMEKLEALLLAVLVPPKPRKKTKPGKGAVERRLKQKKQRSEKKTWRKQDY